MRVDWNRLAAVALLAAPMGGAAACDDGPAEASAGGPLVEADARILFIGNSLTDTNDLPGLVATIVEASGHSISYARVTVPNFSLEDHWNAGVEGPIRRAAADAVVLQQGPSSLPQNQDHLRFWAERLAGPIRQAGGVPALYMVWPEAARPGAFDAVRDSYRGAATAAGGLFIPAGEGWRAAWDRDPDLPLYGPDGFHPSRLGSIVAALTVYSVLLDTTVSDLPVTLNPSSPGLETISLSPGTAAIVYAAVDEAVAEAMDPTFPNGPR